MNAAILQRMLTVLLLAVSLQAGAATAGRAAELPVWRYTVRPGDTLINIAERYLIDVRQWPAVQQANQVDDPYHLMPGTVLRIPAAWLRRLPAAATLATSSGAVRWRRGDGDWQAASSGQRLGSGSTLETLDDASALLRLADGSTVLLSPNSLIVLDSLGVFAGGLMADTRLRLQRGQTDIIANPAKRAHQRSADPDAVGAGGGSRYQLPRRRGQQAESRRNPGRARRRQWRRQERQRTARHGNDRPRR
jgi:LysM repeat protein